MTCECDMVARAQTAAGVGEGGGGGVGLARVQVAALLAHLALSEVDDVPTTMLTLGTTHPACTTRIIVFDPRLNDHELR